MDIYIHGIPLQSTAKDVEQFLGNPLRKLGIEIYHCHKMRDRNFAILTVLNSHEGSLFLANYGTVVHDRRLQPLIQLMFQGSRMCCHRSRNASDEFVLLSLRSRASQKSTNNSKPAVPTTVPLNGDAKSPRKFSISSVACGQLDFAGHDAVFIPHFQDPRNAYITFGQKALSITFVANAAQVVSNTLADRIFIRYNSVEYIGTGTYSDPTITLSLRWAPRFYSKYQPDLSETLSNLRFGPPSQTSHNKGQRYDFNRLTSINNVHTSVVGTCFVYCVRLSDRFDVSKIHQMLQRDQSPPPNIPWSPRLLLPANSLASQMAYLNSQLIGPLRYLDFVVKFQIQRLAQNGYLPPTQVVKLLPTISSAVRSCGTEATAEALRCLARELPFLEPHTSSDELSVPTLQAKTTEYAAKYDRAGSVYGIERRHPHIVLINRALVTPSGVYLNGPDQDIANRVLRKYSDHLDHFIRVEFMDDDGQAIRYEKDACLKEIFHVRFKNVLRTGINIAGRRYEFLGFSHSSLREQSAWFLAPFWHAPSQELMVPALLIRRLGDFSHFRAPAKCAARIGQAFSDTTSSIHIGRHGYTRIPDIERVEYVYQDDHVEPLTRNFSDGVGTLSWDLLQTIWYKHKPSRGLRPTVLQIRFAGAKGMISLDSRLSGEVLNLRESMIKFESREHWDIEICGESTRPLPMFLNRSLIQVLENLGVQAESFLEIQTQRINELRTLMAHPVNAKKFLEDNHVGRSTQMPLLIHMLNDIGLLYQADDFLTRFVEMAVLWQLREMKYRGRIRLDKTQGVNLYGIMDETGYLNEGEIYVPIQRSGEGRYVLQDGRVAITRSPARHPGDVQLVRAVDVPDDSPLNDLHNCVVFSSKGTRDLPSQLSGGDLDGDQFQIIFAAGLLPTQTYPAANYPRVPPRTIDHTVETADIAEFFIEFMENDRLGQICNMHMQLADQRELGILDPDCITLAGLASTAVDFSKTGIQANMNDMPRHSRCKPDFMAPGPHVKVQDRPEIDMDDDDLEQDDPLAEADRGNMYYPSKKALGKLYRAIDEASFLDKIRQDAQHATAKLTGDSMMKKLWEYIKRYTVLLQWDHLRDLALEIRECYEENLINMMHEYSTIPHQPLTEIEVVTGIVFGRNVGAQGKRLREIGKEMKEHYNRDVEFTIRRITHANDESEETREDVLALATACFTIAIEKPGMSTRRIGEVESFRYIAAAVCLKEIKKVQPMRLLA